MFLFLFHGSPLLSQNAWKKISETSNYSSKDIHQSALKNHSITQGKDGLMYFANEYGLMEFTGTSWNILLQPENRSIISELLSSTYNSKIYIGSHGEIGYANKNKHEQTFYKSLNEKLSPECPDFGLILGVFELDDLIYFVSANSLMMYNPKDEKIQCFKLDEEIKHVTVIHNNLYIVDLNDKVSKFIRRRFETVFNPLPEEDIVISKLFPYQKNGLLMITEGNQFLIHQNEKVFELVTDIEPNTSNINSGVLLANNIYCFGTANSGIFFMNEKGKVLQKMGRENKLLSNSVIDLFTDNAGNLWITLEGSISYIEINSPFYTLSEDDGVYGATYDAAILKDTLYLATSSGVYAGEWPLKEEETFKVIKGTEGQIWDLTVYDDVLFIGGHPGAFTLKDKQLNQLSDFPGGWNFIMPPDRKDIILQGSHSGILVHQKINGNWVFKNKIEGFDEIAREIRFERNNEIWVSHGYKGIYKFRLDENYEKIIQESLYDQNHGFPSNLFISILQIEDEVLFGTQLGVYQYDEVNDKMELNSTFTEIIGNEQLVRKLFPIANDKVVFIQGYDRDDDIGVIDFNTNGTPKATRNPLQWLKGKLMPAFENIIKFDENTIGFTSKDGLIIYQEDVELDYQKEFKTILKNVSVKDSVLYGNVKDFFKSIRRDSILEPTLPFEMNKLTFKFLSPFFEYAESVQYQTYLEGLDEDWSDWAYENKKEYNFLPEGEYTFRVKSKNIYDKISDETSYKFVIDPPWYRSIAMYVFYVLLTLIFIYILVAFKNRQKRKVMEKLKLAHKREIEIQKIRFEEKRLKERNKKIVKDNEQLKVNLDNRNKELASSAMQMVQLDNELMQLKKSLSDVYDQTDGQVRKELKTAIKSLDDQIKGDNNWKHFETHFNQIHDNSLDRLREFYPNLNHRELRLCAYLKLNLSSKEIAPLMGISYRGVESLRFRVRKKMNLDTSVNLTDYIIRF